MIEEIRIKDLGVIADATLPLGPGLTAVTGETGAGKTMVVTALGLLLGERADSGVVRAGAEAATVAGLLVGVGDAAVIERVNDAGGVVEDGELVLGRTIALADGGARSRAVVGGRSAPSSVLAEVGERLVVIHGQSEQIRLRSRTAQREALDRFAGAAAAELTATLAAAHAGWRADAAELARLVAERGAREAEASELRAAIDRIEALGPRPGEDVELAATAERLTNLESLRAAAAEAHELLSSEQDAPDAAGLLGQARRGIERAAEHDPALAPIAEALASLVYAVGDATMQLAGYLDGLEAGGERLDAIQARRAELTEIIRQSGPTLDDVLALLDTGSARLLELDRTDARIEELERSVAGQEAEVEGLAARLTAVRTEAARRLETEVSAELAALAMPDARLVVAIEPAERITAQGRDEVELRLAAHPGAEPRPIAKGASGGELSRIMLALEVVVAAGDPVPTFVFDEVDAGVGGAAAIEIGRRLAALARHSQVVVVTHLAQVAAFADRHLRVHKDTAGGFTASSVERLEGQEREREMARLLSGLADSPSGLEHARELLALR